MRAQDDVAGSDNDASMTAFCLIAMQESRHLCDISVSVSSTSTVSISLSQNKYEVQQ